MACINFFYLLMVISSTTVPTYTLLDPGMYSVVLTVTDSVGNAALARGLLLWDHQSTVTTVTQRPMSVSGVTPVSEKGDTYVWLTSTVDIHRPVTVNFHGHFENTFHHKKKLLNQVKPWPDSKGTIRPMLRRGLLLLIKIYI